MRFPVTNYCTIELRSASPLAELSRPQGRDDCVGNRLAGDGDRWASASVQPPTPPDDQPRRTSVRRCPTVDASAQCASSTTHTRGRCPFDAHCSLTTARFISVERLRGFVIKSGRQYGTRQHRKEIVNTRAEILCGVNWIGQRKTADVRHGQLSPRCLMHPRAAQHPPVRPSRLRDMQGGIAPMRPNQCR